MLSVRDRDDNARTLISVVVPTFHRPDLLMRAVDSVLGQTFRDFEVIVVVDDREDATVNRLKTVVDERLRFVVPSRTLGNAEARNLGVREANGRWIAFLDDDDHWMPDKLARQLAIAENSAFKHPIVTCAILARNEVGEFLWPRRYPERGERISDFILARRSLFTGEGIVQTSTVFVERALLDRIPFDSGLRKHVDLAWFVSVSDVEGVGIEFVPGDPLSVWNIESSRKRISTTNDWRLSLQWIRDRKKRVSKRAYASFLLTETSGIAAREGDYHAMPILLGEAIAHGEPNAFVLLRHVCNFLVPMKICHFAAVRFGGRPT